MIVPSLPAAGMEIVVARMVRRLVHRGVEVAVTCTESAGPVADDLRASGVEVAVVPAPGLRSNVWAPELEAHLRRRAPDVVHVHSGVWLKAARAARRAGVPGLVHTAHGLLDREPVYAPWLKRRAAAVTDRIVVVSPPLRDHFVKRVGIPAHRVEVIENGVDTDVFRPKPRDGALRFAWGLGPDDLVIGIVARFAPVKNHALLIGAFGTLAEAIPTARLVLVGDGPLRSELEAQVDAAGLESRVVFAGLHKEVDRVYRAFDLFVLPSLAEGTSMSILEAMATGLCVVATDVGGNTTLLSDGHGLLVPSGDPVLLSQALERAAGDPDFRRRVGVRARRRVEERFSESTMVDRYLDLYGQLTPTEATEGTAACAE